MKVRLIQVGAAGAMTPILATQITRRVEIIEDGSANEGVGQGLFYQMTDGSADPEQVFTIEPQSEPIILGDPIPQGRGYGRVLGNGPDQSGGYEIPATVLIKVSSASASPTAVRVTEFD